MKDCNDDARTLAIEPLPTPLVPLSILLEVTFSGQLSKMDATFANAWQGKACLRMRHHCLIERYEASMSVDESLLATDACVGKPNQA